jgi:hypothetical protein
VNAAVDLFRTAVYFSAALASKALMVLIRWLMVSSEASSDGKTTTGLTSTGHLDSSV